MANDNKDFIDCLVVNTKHFDNGGHIYTMRVNPLKLATELKEKGYQPGLDVWVNIAELKKPLVSKAGEIYKTHYCYIYNPNKGAEAVAPPANDLLGDDNLDNVDLPF